MADWPNTGVGRGQARVWALRTFAFLSFIALVPIDGTTFAADTAATSCPDGNAGLALPKGFCATIFADQVGAPRHMAVAADGTVYVNNRRRGQSPSLLALKDTKGDGRADIVQIFGPPGAGGTGIAIYKNWLYVEIADEIIRYALASATSRQRANPRRWYRIFRLTAITRLALLRLIRKATCSSIWALQRIRVSRTIGRNNRLASTPCVELKMRAGVWRFDANKTGQVFSSAERFATGLRNAEGIDFDEAGRIFATQHGRDQLHENWPNLYSPGRGSELPAEVMVELQEGGDYGWPYCYSTAISRKTFWRPNMVAMAKLSDDARKSVLLSPRFPATGPPTTSRSTKAKSFPRAIAAVPSSHFMARGIDRPGRRRAITSSSSRSKTARHRDRMSFSADGFRNGDGTGTEHRPTGLAVGPDGALYVADDAAGRIWRIVYEG